MGILPGQHFRLELLGCIPRVLNRIVTLLIYVVVGCIVQMLLWLVVNCLVDIFLYGRTYNIGELVVIVCKYIYPFVDTKRCIRGDFGDLASGCKMG